MQSASRLIIFRAIKKLIKQPSAPLMGFMMSLFFLIVYNAGIGGIGFLGEFGESGYLAFIFPITLVSLAMGSASGAGQTLSSDMQSGYFNRLFFSPASRQILIFAPMIADSISSIFFSAVLLLIGALFGLPFQYGFLSIAGVLLLSLLWSITLCGFSAGVLARTGQHQSASIVTNAVFPLLFLSTTFLPRELISAEWLVYVSWANPVTYILEANRFLLGGTSSERFFVLALLIFSVLSITSIFFAISSAKKIRV